MALPIHPQNNFQRQPLNQNPHPAPGVSVPQTRSPEVPRVTGMARKTTTQHQRQLCHLFIIRKWERQFKHPRRITMTTSGWSLQGCKGNKLHAGLPATLRSNGNTTTEEHSIGSPAVNYSSPPVVPATHPQNNYGTPRNGSSYNAPRSNPSQVPEQAIQSHEAAPSSSSSTSSSRTSNRQDQDQDKRGH